MADEARTADACRFTEIAIAVMEAGAKNLRTLEDMSRELANVKWAIDAMSGQHNPDDLARIAKMEAEVRDLKARIDNYYETPNSRRGMPSLYDAEVKKFDKERAEACGRPMPEARRGPPMGHPGASHHAKPEGTIRRRCCRRRCPAASHPLPAGFPPLPAHVAPRASGACGTGMCAQEGRLAGHCF